MKLPQSTQIKPRVHVTVFLITEDHHSVIFLFPLYTLTLHSVLHNTDQKPQNTATAISFQIPPILSSLFSFQLYLLNNKKKKRRHRNALKLSVSVLHSPLETSILCFCFSLQIGEFYFPGQERSTIVLKCRGRIKA